MVSVAACRKTRQGVQDLQDRNSEYCENRDANADSNSYANSESFVILDIVDNLVSRAISRGLIKCKTSDCL